ncbi:MAG: M23 family metallopeptidase [Helicobacter sp.]|nr:M23 family metallopeptidase [Helicobacteraceae bacterium]MDY3113018.1 M23 family metallopeptidase [Helicobacter sp.]
MSGILKFIFIFSISLSYAFSSNLTIENGKTLILSTKEKSPAPIKLGQRSYKWLNHPTNKDEKIAILAIPYREKLESQAIFEDKTIKIIAGNYKKEAITAQPSKVKPNPQNQARIKKERDEANKIYSNYSQTRLWDSSFILPMESKITSAYGNARTFNGEVKSYHSGTDFRAAVGKEIKATNRGKVVISKDRFLAGGSIVLDHGEGIFSMYYHCSKLLVKEGDIVEKGDIVALSGASGRVSGPHLHFGILVRGAQIDPLDFITQVNALF